jgi:hypothetical protein
VASGRISALAIDPAGGITQAEQSRDEDDSDCRPYVGAAGGGIWRTTRPFSSNPNWKFASGGFATNAIGTIAIDPRNPNVVYAGTGEPNSSADSAAGLGLYRSDNGGETWQHITSTVTFIGRNGPVTIADGFSNLSISNIAFDPRNTRTFYVATTLGVRGVSAPAGAVIAAHLANPSLYKTTDGGSTFTEIWNGGGASCAPFGGACRTSWGVDRVQLDPDDPNIIYASAVDVGIWRSWAADNGAFTQIFFSQNQANVGIGSNRVRCYRVAERQDAYLRGDWRDRRIQRLPGATNVLQSGMAHRQCLASGCDVDRRGSRRRTRRNARSARRVEEAH